MISNCNKKIPVWYCPVLNCLTLIQVFHKTAFRYTPGTFDVWIYLHYHRFYGSWRSNKLLHDVVGAEILKMIQNEYKVTHFPRSAAAIQYPIRPTEKLLVLLWPSSPWWLGMSLRPRDTPVSREQIVGYLKWWFIVFCQFQLHREQPMAPGPSLTRTMQPFCK